MGRVSGHVSEFWRPQDSVRLHQGYWTASASAAAILCYTPKNSLTGRAPNKSSYPSEIY